MANNYDINYNDERFQKVEAAKNTALNEVDKTYGEMISQSDSYFDKQIAASEKWADKQTELQNQKTNQAIKEINQQKDQAKKDYTKEQSGAYVDWQKQSNEYGVNSEKVAAGGLQNTGFAESSQVSMYNTYQNRVATAREAYVLAVQNYDNAIANAKLQNSSILAEIAYEALQKQLELSLQGFQYKNQLVLEKANKKTQLDSEYYSRYQDVLKQINTENALAEEVRQYNEQMAEEKRQYNESLALQKAQLDEEKRQFEVTQANKKSSSGGGGGSGGSGGSGGGGGLFVEPKDGNGQPEPKPQKGIKTYESNMGSLQALGLGNATAGDLARLLDQGIIKRTLVNGKWYYTRGNNNRLKNMALSR